MLWDKITKEMEQFKQGFEIQRQETSILFLRLNFLTGKFLKEPLLSRALRCGKEGLAELGYDIEEIQAAEKIQDLEMAGLVDWRLAS